MMKWAVSVILSLALVGSIAISLFLFWSFAEARDKWGTGDALSLKHDMTVFTDGSTRLAFTLPKGTKVIDSTPKGAATLGKFYGHKFTLVLSQDDVTEGSQINTELFDFVRADPKQSSQNNYSLRVANPL